MDKTFNRKEYIIMIIPIAVSSLLSKVARGIYGPSLPQICEDLGVTKAQVTGTTSTFLLTYAIIALFLGALVDYYNKRKLLMTGILISILGSFLCAIAPSLAILTLGRAIQGVSCAILLITSQTWLTESSSDKNMVKSIAYFSLILMIGPIIAPALGGFITEYLSWRYSFVFLILIALFTLCFTFKSKNSSQYAKKDPKDIALGATIKSYFTLFTSPLYITLFAISAVAFVFQSVFMSMSSFMFQDDFGLSPMAFGLTSIPIVLGIMIGRFPIIKMEKKYGRKLTLMVSIIAMLASAAIPLAYYFFFKEYNPWIIIACVTIFNTGFCGYSIVSLSTMMKEYKMNKGLVSSTNSFFAQTITYLGALFVQMLFAYHITSTQIFNIAAIILLVFGLLFSLRLRKIGI